MCLGKVFFAKQLSALHRECSKSLDYDLVLPLAKMQNDARSGWSGKLQKSICSGIVVPSLPNSMAFVSLGNPRSQSHRQSAGQVWTRVTGCLEGLLNVARGT
eukprot:s699_g2.t6